MSNDTFSRDHWVNIEPERFKRYVQMFEWSEGSRSLLEPAAIAPGDVVVDLGCGPGFTAVEMSKWVGPTGHVYGIELNQEFVDFANSLARGSELQDRVSFHHTDSGEIPIDDESVDCVVAKNVLVYVDDLAEAYMEGYRVLKPGGRYHAVDGDWDLAIAEPVPKDLWARLTDAASIAFRNPNAGRKLYGAAVAAGYGAVDVSVLCRPDTSGRLLPMIHNLCGYAKQSAQMTHAEIDRVLAICEEAQVQGTLFAMNPQFLVTATR